MRRDLVSFASCILLTLGSSFAAPKIVTNFNKFALPGTYTGSFRLDDHDRSFIVVTPPGLETDDLRPIVFFLHGAGGSAEQAARCYGWVEKARAEKFFLVFPQGLPVQAERPVDFEVNPNVWRDERGDLSGTIDDIHFFTTLLDKLEAVLPIDHRRVFVTGFSNGGAMSFALGAHLSDRVAAIAPVCAQSYVQADSLKRPLSVYYLAGTADPVIPFHGGLAKLPWGTTREMPPVQDSVDKWAQLDGCSPVPKQVSDEGGVQVLRYGPGHYDAEVLVTVVLGNGHHWPTSVESLPPAISGPTRDPFSATDRIWDFFEHHPLAQAP